MTEVWRKLTCSDILDPEREVLYLLSGGDVIYKDYLVSLQFPKGKYDDEIVQLIAAYLSWVWRDYVYGGVIALDKRNFWIPQVQVQT